MSSYEYGKAWKKANPDKVKNWRNKPEQREKTKERSAAWYSQNQEKVNRRAREWRNRNRDRVLSQAKARYHADPKKHLESRRRWAREHPAENKLAHFVRHLKRKYNISLEYFNLMLENQAGLCAMCTEPMKPGRHTHVDHCHETGTVRGLLCGDCNRGLGFIQKSHLLSDAVSYLRSL